jgi:hypothetical protein
MINFLYTLFGLPIPPIPPPRVLSALDVIKYSLDKLHTELASYNFKVDDNKSYLALVAQLDRLNAELVRRSQAESVQDEANPAR